ncbi:MAG: hypothetical protein AAF799_13655 [Myxococcota bacterium]
MSRACPTTIRTALGLLTAAALAACPSDDAAPQAETTSATDDGGATETSSGDAPADSSGGGASSGEVELPPGCVDPGTEGATAACLQPTMPPEYYVAEAEAYFDTLDIDAPRDSVPNYHPQVARWEWPPWLLLTGYGDNALIDTAETLRAIDPSTVPIRDCRFFEVQPFARCYVVFEYEEGPCPIYEEFTFNDAGEMTWIEAWSDLPGLLPQDMSDEWAELPDYPRLANRIPGLGNATGTIDLDSSAMEAAAMADPEVADFVMRARDWWTAWIEALDQAKEDFFAVGCGW